jgi:Tol biopolymer transport system component
LNLNPGIGRRLTWSLDGSRLFYPNRRKLFELSLGSNQTREVAEFAAESPVRVLGGITPDERAVVYGTGVAVFLLALDGKAKPQRVTPERSDNFALSPDGTWIVYSSRMEGRLYAQPVSGGGVPKQIADIGNAPVWRADGKEILYYLRPRGVMSIKVEGSGAGLRFSAPEPLFPAALPMGGTSSSRPLAVNRDGSRIYFLVSKEQPDSGVIQVRTNAIR